MVICTLGVASVVYNFLQCDIILLFPFDFPFLSNILSIWQAPEPVRWRFMDMSPKFEAGVRALLVPTVHTRVPYSHQLWEPSYDKLSRVYHGKLRPHTLSHRVHRIVSRILRQTISAHFAAIGVYPLLHGAYCSQGLNPVMANCQIRGRCSRYVGFGFYWACRSVWLLKKGVELVSGE